MPRPPRITIPSSNSMADLSQQLSFFSMNTPSSPSIYKTLIPGSTRQLTVRAGRDKLLHDSHRPLQQHRRYTAGAGPQQQAVRPAVLDAGRLRTPVTTPPNAGNPTTMNQLLQRRIDSLKRQHQIRQASSARRHKKMLNIAPAPDPDPPADAASQQRSTPAEKLDLPRQPRSPALPSITAGTTGRSRLGRKGESQAIDEKSSEVQMQKMKVSEEDKQENPRKRPLMSSTPGDHVVFNPPPSVPNPYHTPRLFLPRSDARKNMVPPSLSSATSTSSAAPTTSSIPTSSPTAATEVDNTNESSLPDPLIRRNHNSATHTKSYNLTPSIIAELRKLRASNPNKWGREQLAEKFGCSPLFAGMCSAGLVSKTKVRRTQTGRQGKGHRIKLEERRRRRELWGVQE
ncbi:MAG: hypothetical protein M1831_005584 [Alyxoria varia]|nr:MAG: hypothetical protein M1831_005584 [Alyxoria varia]